jgi:hypothetical protein
MSEPKVDRKHLERRRDEILAELNKVNNAERIELDRDPEEQAIQLEQEDVSITMERSLRAELDSIEEQLAGTD